MALIVQGKQLCKRCLLLSLALCVSAFSFLKFRHTQRILRIYFVYVCFFDGSLYPGSGAGLSAQTGVFNVVVKVYFRVDSEIPLLKAEYLKNSSRI